MARALTKEYEVGFARLSVRRGRSRELRLTLEFEEPPDEEINRLLTEISESLKRARKTQAQINRLKKKTQAILDKLQKRYNPAD